MRAKKTHQTIQLPSDDLNQEIIRFLEMDGRMAFSEIAQHLNVSEGTIRNRVARLRENNMLRIVAMSDPVANEYATDAMIGIKVVSGITPQQVAARLEHHRCVVFILWVAGRYDLLVEIISNDDDTLRDFLEDEIHSQHDIAHADVMVGLKNLKNQFLLKRSWNEASDNSS